MEKVAVFISGNGSNAECIYTYFLHHKEIQFDVLVCNNQASKFYQKASDLSLDTLFLEKKIEFDVLLEKLKKRGVTWIILAGFLWKIPSEFIAYFPDKIINIHPSLLPRHGGKGMYGAHVHRSVIEQKDKQTGITIHLVNEKYDKGEIIFQATVDVLEEDTVKSIQQKVHNLEHKYYSLVIENYIHKSKML